MRTTLRKAVRSSAWRRTSLWIRGGARGPAAGHEIEGVEVPADVVVYFGDGASKIYQLTQWLPVLEGLHAQHRVLLVFRKLDALRAVRGHTTLPRLFVRRFADLMALYDANEYALGIYVNNGVTNFQSLSHPRMVHVHVNHGESDKISMVSNQAKAYDRVFIAGRAALERHRKALIDFDESKLVEVGRPQLDEVPAPSLPASDLHTVMYAPTWEGENEGNNYTSLDRYGVAVVTELLRRPGTRVVYKPHPRVAESPVPAVAAAHQQIVELLQSDPTHVVSVEGDILAMFARVDALVTDVSSVGLDFLYLHPDRPLVLTDRRSDPEQLAENAPVSRSCAVVDETTLPDLASLLRSAIDEDSHAAERQQMRAFYFGDAAPGSSTARFRAAVAELVGDRRQKLTRHVKHASSMEAADTAEA